MLPDAALMQQVLHALRPAGEYQLSHFRKLGGGREKGPYDLVSEVDCNTEEMLRAALLKALPGSSFWGEESGRETAAECEWVVDPLDGTTNYLNGLDQFSISIALLYQGRPVLGVVHRPASGETFSARRGGGLLYNGSPLLPPSWEPPALRQALIGTGFPYRSVDLQPAFFRTAAALMGNSRDIRRMGSAALDLSYVAAGWLQGFWESDLQPYDVAATLLFLEESGCRVSDGLGAPYRIGESRLMVAARPQIFDEFLNLVSSGYRDAAPGG
jgi:myo-inositol-1(or 4)-monophosphatase